MASRNVVEILIKTIASGQAEVKSLNSMIKDGYAQGKLAVQAFNKATGDGRKAVTDLRDGVKDLIKTYLGLEAAKAAFGGMITVLKEADQAQFSFASSIQSANREFENTGSIGYWESAIKDLSKELVVYSETSLKGAVSRTVDMTKRLGLSAEQMTEVIKRTADLSAGKTDLQGGIERVTSGLRGEAEASEYLGLTLNENYVKAWHEAHNAHGQAWQDLTDLEKAQVRYAVFLEQTASIQGRSAESDKTLSGAMLLVDKAISDSITNNKDLAKAMSEVAKFIRENADSIGEMASDLVTLTAQVALFAVQWKDVLVTLGALYAAGRAIAFIGTVVTGISAAMKVLAATSAAGTVLELAAASRVAMLAGVPLASFLTAGLAVAAAMAAQQVLSVVSALMEMKKWNDVAREDSAIARDIAEKNNAEARKIGEQLGINISSTRELFKLEKDGIIIRNQATGEWEKATKAMADQSRQVELSKEKLKQLEDTLKEVGTAYDALRGRVTGYFDFAAQKARALETNERTGMQSSLNIQREKMAVLLQIARDEESQKKQILQDSGASQEQAADLSKSIAQDVKTARINAVKDWESTLRSALLEAINKEKEYAAEVKRLQGHLVDVRSQGQDRIRELQRRTMTEEQQYYDKQKQALASLAAARKAMSTAQTPDDLKKAEEMAKKAEDQFASLAGEVKDGEQVIISEAKSVADATKGVSESIKVQEDAVKKQIALTEQMQKQRQEDMAAFQKQLEDAKGWMDQINNTPIEPTATFHVDTSAVDAAIQRIQQPTSSTHTIYVTEVKGSRWGGEVRSQVRQFAQGGWNRLSGRLPGWGGGDRIRALLEAGEFIIRKEAVSKYGAGFFALLNNMKIDIPALAAGAVSNMPKVAYADGGAVAGSDYGTLRLEAADTELPALIPGPNGREMVRSFERQLEKMRLTRGR